MGARFFKRARQGLAFTLIYFVSVATFAQTAPEKIVVREKSTPCGVYMSSAAEPLVGEKVAGNSIAEARAWLATQPALAPEDVYLNIETGKIVSEQEAKSNPEVHRKSQNRKYIYIKGFPFFSKEGREIARVIREYVKSQQISDGGKKAKVRYLWEPGGKWEVVERFMSAPPSLKDVVPISRQEVRQGLQSVILSTAIGVTVQLFAKAGESGWDTAMAVVIPAAFVNMLQSIAMSFPRRSWGNYFLRAPQLVEPVFNNRLTRQVMSEQAIETTSRIVGSVVQQAGFTAFFQTNVYWAGRGSWEEFFKIGTKEAWTKFLESKWGSMLFNIIWRTPSENSVAKYAKNEAKAGRGSTGQAEAARVRKWLTIIATNCWIYSYLTSNGFGHFLGVNWNWGHVGMAVIGVFGVLSLFKPSLIKHMDQVTRRIDPILKPLDIEWYASLWRKGLKFFRGDRKSEPPPGG